MGMVGFTPLSFIPKETAPGNHWIGGLMDPRAGLETVEKRKILPCWELSPAHPAFNENID
jgi:hypothetical protein